MKLHTFVAITVVTLAAALAESGRLVAQDGAAQRGKAMHHHYKLIEIGTFGGPNSTMQQPGTPPSVPFVRILNRAGAEIGTGDTSSLDPFCYLGGSPCHVGYVFRWQDGVLSNLGVLLQNPTAGPQMPCLDCTWSTFAFDIADNGLVAGEYEDNALDPLTGAPTSLAVLWKDGKIFNLGTLGGNESAAAAVNRRGEVVGAALTSTPDPYPGQCPWDCAFFIYGNGTEAHAFLWRDGTMQDLGTLGGPDSGAFFVNNEGEVAGVSDVDLNVNPRTGGLTIHPFLWKNGEMHDLIADAPSGMFGGTYGIVSGLNEHGQVTGTMNLAGETAWHSFFWEATAIRDLGTLGGSNTTAIGLNSAGHVVGKSDVTLICTACPAGSQLQLHHPFLWKDGALTDLGLLYADTAGTAYNINAKDQAVGVTVPCVTVNPDDSCDGPIYHSFLWENDSIVDLQTLVLPGSGITLNCPSSGGRGCVGPYNINDRGEIAGQGVLSTGESRAYLLIPCDSDHPDVEGCDYDPAGLDPTAENSPASEVTTSNKLGPIMRRAAPLDPTNQLRMRFGRHYDSDRISTPLPRPLPIN